jgi:hypothetical protein
VVEPLPADAMSFGVWLWPLDDPWGEGRLFRLFLDGLPRCGRILHHDPPETSIAPNVLFTFCSRECLEEFRRTGERVGAFEGSTPQ